MNERRAFLSSLLLLTLAACDKPSAPAPASSGSAAAKPAATPVKLQLDWVPEPEWIAWVAEFYPAGNDTLERVAAHNITGELGAAQGMEDLLPRVPPNVQKAIGKILPDERFHIALGRTTVLRYATTADAQRRVRERVMGAFALERAGRAAYDRRIAALSS